MIDIELMGNNIRTVLETVNGIEKAYDHEPQNMNLLPAATLFFDGFGQEEQTTRRNSVGWNWIIRLYVPIRTSNIRDPQIKIRKLIAETIKQFRNDDTIGNSCLYHTISSGDVFTILDQKTPLMGAELTLVATTEEY